MGPAHEHLLRAGLVQSLLIKGQRATLDEIGRALSTRVLYLKAAWADPVLYGGRGDRTGSDIDVLVAPAAFEAFGAALQAQGFRRHLHPSASYERYFGHKEWSFAPPPGAVGVDLHRSLTEPVWYDLRTEDLMARARAWDSIDGPIWSLDAEDQILYGAAHYSNHLYDLDPRHLDDCDRLVQTHAIDWGAVWQRTVAAGLSLPVALLVDALLARGRVLPEGARGGDRSLGLRLRRRLADLWVTTSPQLERRRARRRIDHVSLRPLLSDQITALPRVLLAYGVPWVVEHLRGQHAGDRSRR